MIYFLEKYFVLTLLRSNPTLAFLIYLVDDHVCNNYNCGHHGTCVINRGMPECVCNVGYSGPHCHGMLNNFCSHDWFG